MAGVFTLPVISNAEGLTRRLLYEVLAVEATRQEPRLAIINRDVGLLPNLYRPKQAKEDALWKHAQSFPTSEAAVLEGAAFREFLRDAARPRGQDLLRDRKFLVYPAEEDIDWLLGLASGLCFILVPDHSSIPYLYAKLQNYRAGEIRPPVRIVLVGEPCIEKAAEFFLGLKNEVEGLTGESLDFNFAGHVAFDQDQVDLALGYNLNLLEAFPGGTTHGQFKHIVQNLLICDATRSEVPDADWLRAFQDR
ncbi:MAG: hypothetical protein A2087_11285 [Spirochaetes bacterium GWD1_61_31]|nr:MAG: hypothetical protein A2Y37_01285 [Spirochaetes bacterium GWB1_60_80]OHD33552.1 MAG: hypothetical protein A2004_06585 [Spirochaetes bacterium GWC1_61_12]OHD35700.1 MAG: hypothetical protein A2087_11285 [Spirochaetes bacterium GWD1_61_31]OHD41837.1 MAG: hypothetical protein A2Y35_04380 [Spirochaetes bacterium GWE1_60_18]OHD57817.1 MAG: hypothetical protein A2Y32_14075 [Spirochaetes bacterium GWF1_60_12]HAP42584.1 hypothetical protein [Spirochaetaceae bacterium]